MWLEYHYENEDLLPQIYESVTGYKYVELHPERLKHRPHQDLWQVLSEVDDEDGRRVLGALLTIEAQCKTLSRHNQQYSALEKYFDHNYRTRSETIYRGYLAEAAANPDLTDSTLDYLKLTNRPLPHDKILKFI